MDSVRPLMDGEPTHDAACGIAAVSRAACSSVTPLCYRFLPPKTAVLVLIAAAHDSVYNLVSAQQQSCASVGAQPDGYLCSPGPPRNTFPNSCKCMVFLSVGYGSKPRFAKARSVVRGSCRPGWFAVSATQVTAPKLRSEEVMGRRHGDPAGCTLEEKPTKAERKPARLLAGIIIIIICGAKEGPESGLSAPRGRLFLLRSCPRLGLGPRGTRADAGPTPRFVAILVGYRPR